MRRWKFPANELLRVVERNFQKKKQLHCARLPTRIRRFHERQLSRSWKYHGGGRHAARADRVTPLERVGLYVPGGKAAYPSSVLMNAIPAKVAGVREVVMVSPNPNPLVLAAAAIAGVDRVIAIGGAQAVAALAYGTRSVPRVDKIVGPGNAYVAEAKRQVFGQVGIDMIAGPSEILVIGDGTTPADWVAMDLFSQAEHDELAQAILLSPSFSYLNDVENEIEQTAFRNAKTKNHCRLAGSARRPDPHAQPRRGLRDREPHRARAPRAVGRQAARAAAEAAPRRRDLPRPLELGGDRRLLRRPEPRPADLGHGALLVAARASTISRSAPA